MIGVSVSVSGSAFAGVEAVAATASGSVIITSCYVRLPYTLIVVVDVIIIIVIIIIVVVDIIFSVVGICCCTFGPLHIAYTGNTGNAAKQARRYTITVSDVVLGTLSNGF